MPVVRELLISLRPQQWTKNSFVFAAVVFTGRLFDPDALLNSVVVFVAFCLVSSAGYLVNDVVDQQADRAHPRKRERPVAAGALSSRAALAAAAVLMPVGLGMGFVVRASVGWTLLAYVMLTLSYSAWLKHVVIVDVMAVALCYVLRVVAGGFAVGVVSTPWSLVCTFFLALLLVSGKRVGEKRALAAPIQHRTVLDEYPAGFLSHVLLLAAIAAIMAYTLFTFTSGKSVHLMLTVPFVVYGVLRYLYLVEEKGSGEAPEVLFWQDLPLRVAVLAWAAAAVTVLYLSGS